MRTLLKASTFVLAASLFIPVARAQAPEKTTAPKPPDSPSKVLLDSWNDIGRKLIAMAEDMPEDKYDFKPTPAQRSLPSNCCTRPGPITSSSTRSRASSRPKGDPKRADYKTKAAVVISSRSRSPMEPRSSRAKAIPVWAI